MPHGILTLDHMWWYNIIQVFELNVLNYFKIIIIIMFQINSKTHGSTSFAFNCDQNNCILVTCDNMYTMESKDEMYLLTFSFI
jgi:uncharacterized membrane protein YjgN (DUF898 family)